MSIITYNTIDHTLDYLGAKVLSVSYTHLHIQQKKLDGDNYFLTLNLLNIDDNYNLLFVEGDFDKCTVTVLKRYILSENQFEEWKKIICSSFECEVLKDFSNNKYFDDEKNLHNEFIKFLESIRYQ